MTPIPVAPTPQGTGAGLRGRVDQQLESATKALSGVVDSSVGILRAFLPGGNPDVGTPSASEDQRDAPWNAMRPGFGLLRRESGFSIASLAASAVAIGRERSRSGQGLHRVENEGRQMTEVSSRPGSRHSLYLEESESESGEEEEEDKEEESEESEQEVDGGVRHDARSIRSFESMMSGAATKPKTRKNGAGSLKNRKSLSDRLASMPGLGRIAQQHNESIKVSPSAIMLVLWWLT